MGKGRTMAEARLEGDWYEIRRLDTGATLSMPGCRGIKETLRGARANKWPQGTQVELRLYLPGGCIGCEYMDASTVAAVLP